MLPDQSLPTVWIYNQNLENILLHDILSSESDVMQWGHQEYSSPFSVFTFCILEISNLNGYTQRLCKYSHKK